MGEMGAKRGAEGGCNSGDGDFFTPYDLVVQKLCSHHPREKCNVLDMFSRCVLEVSVRCEEHMHRTRVNNVGTR